jgi:hypothetical protein
MVAQVDYYTRGWLKAFALMNVPFKVVARATSHASRGWLKAFALANVLFKVVTFDTSHAPMSSLNVALVLQYEVNKFDMSVTAAVSQLEISP